MNDVVFKARPELSRLNGAIDGIPVEKVRLQDDAQGNPRFRDAEEAIRPDVRAILLMSNDSFNSWYTKRLDTAETLLEQFQLAYDVPHLQYSASDRPLTIGTSSSHARGSIETLKESISFLKLIKRVRDEDIPS